MYYSAIGILAVLVLFIVNHDILVGRRASFDRPAWKMYRKFLFVVFLYYITDIFWGFFESRKLVVPLFADTTLYYIAMAAGILYWAGFTVAYSEEKNSFGRFIRIACNVLALLIAVLSVVNVFTPILFTVSADCVYEALPLRYVCLGAQILLLLLISVYAFAYTRRQKAGSAKRQRFLILASFGLIMTVFLTIQLWFPYLPLYTVAYMLATSMLHSFVVNDEKEEYRQELAEARHVTELKETMTSLLDNMPALAFTKDAETGVYLACNQAFAEYAHKETPEGVVGLTDAEIFDAETARHFVEDDKTALSLSKPYVFFEDVPDAAGNQRQFQTTKLKYTDASGRACLLGMCEDMTDMVRIQHENAMTKEAYETAVSSGLMYNRIDQTLARDYTDMFQVNTDTEEFIEYRRTPKPDEAPSASQTPTDEAPSTSQTPTGGALSETRRGWHFFSDCVSEMAENIYADDRENFRQAMTRKTLMKALSLKNIFIMTYRQLEAGRPVYVTMKVSRMEDDEQFIIVGITNVDAEMRDAMARSEVLAEALASAEEANKARSTFLSAMSHEIRTPMNAIIGLDTLALKKDNLDPATREHLEKIGVSARHLLSVINDILDMSRIESGHIALRKEEFSLTALLEAVGAQAVAMCNDKGLSYEGKILNETAEYFIGDDTKIREVLNNILSNAVKFTDAPGSVTLTAEQTAVFEDRATLRFVIRDTGIGMDEAFIPRIFDAFAQEDSSNKNKYGGTGLGMAITKRIVEILNGAVSVESEKGVGTAVTVTVTLRISDHQAAETPVDLGALYVLVVDDEPIEAEHARLLLEEAGIRADACTGGQEALRLMEEQHAKRRPYNLVLMDWNMPGMNGLEASAEIRRQFKDESAVVVLTAYNWDDIREQAKRVGVHSCLPKPLSVSGLTEEIERIVRRGSAPQLRETRQANLAGRRIRLAEDLQSNAEIMMDILEMENIATDHAANGRIAVEMFRGSAPGTYAAILMDVRMPELDGLEATAAIRALDRPDARRVPIIALTANAFDEDVQRSLQAGMNAHLSKPVESDHLIRILGELVYQAEET